MLLIAALSLQPLLVLDSAQAAPIHPIAESTTAPWSAGVRGALPQPSTLLAGSSTVGPVTLVAVRSLQGRPRISVVRAVGRAEAARLALTELADPQLVSLSRVQVVSVESTTAQASPGLGDPFVNQQWALSRLDAQTLWQTQPGRSVVVAVVDTGVQTTHPDLVGDLVPGWDFITNGPTRVDPHGHGTHVAGIIAATANNGIGIAGLAQGVKVMPVRVLDGTGSGTDATVAQGVVWAVDHGAAVINLSIGSADYSAPEAAAVAYAISRGVVVVAAAGNYRDNGNPVIYPAAFGQVIGVGASTPDGAIASFSNTGSYVDLAAPGTGIISTYPPDGYASIDGTSMAAPFVAATVAEIRAAAPLLSVVQVTKALTTTALDLPPSGRDDASGAGLVQPVAAVLAARSMARPIDLAGAALHRDPTVLEPIEVPAQVRFGTTTTLWFRLWGNGALLAGQRIQICWRTAPSSRSVCSVQVSDVDGRVWVRAPVQGHLSVMARYLGGPQYDACVATPVRLPALPALGLRGARRQLTLTVAPVAPGELVTVQRSTSLGWSQIGVRAVPASGRVVITGLAKGTYRILVPETDRTSAASTSTLTLP